MSLCSIFTGCKPFAISFGGFRQPIHLFMREVASISQSVKCYFEDLAVVYFFNYHYRTTYSFRREIFRWIDPSEKISLSRISLERDFRMKAG